MKAIGLRASCHAASPRRWYGLVCHRYSMKILSTSRLINVNLEASCHADKSWKRSSIWPDTPSLTTLSASSWVEYSLWMFYNCRCGFNNNASLPLPLYTCMQSERNYSDKSIVPICAQNYPEQSACSMNDAINKSHQSHAYFRNPVFSTKENHCVWIML